MGLENQDIKIDIKTAKANKQIIDTYLTDLPEAEKGKMEKELSDIQKQIDKEKLEVVKGTKKDLATLMETINTGLKARTEYGNTLIGKISLDSMREKMTAMSAEMKTEKTSGTTLNKYGAALIMPLQMALNKAGYKITVDGLMIKGGETEKALLEFQSKNTLLKATGTADFLTVSELSKLLIPVVAPAKPKAETVQIPAGSLDRLHSVKDFFDAAQDVIHEVKQSTGTSEYKNNQVALAKQYLMLGRDIDPVSRAHMLLDARRENAPGGRNYESALSELNGAKTELLRIQKVKNPGTQPALDPSLTEKQKELANKSRARRVEESQTKADIWARQEAIQLKKVAAAQTVVDTYPTVVDKNALAGKFDMTEVDQGLSPEHSKILVDAYVDSYVGPIIPDDFTPRAPRGPRETITIIKKPAQKEVVKETTKTVEKTKDKPVAKKEVAKKTPANEVEKKTNKPVAKKENLKQWVVEKERSGKRVPEKEALANLDKYHLELRPNGGYHFTNNPRNPLDYSTTKDGGQETHQVTFDGVKKEGIAKANLSFRPKDGYTWKNFDYVFDYSSKKLLLPEPAPEKGPVTVLRNGEIKTQQFDQVMNQLLGNAGLTNIARLSKEEIINPTINVFTLSKFLETHFTNRQDVMAQCDHGAQTSDGAHILLARVVEPFQKLFDAVAKKNEKIKDLGARAKQTSEDCKKITDNMKVKIQDADVLTLQYKIS